MAGGIMQLVAYGAQDIYLTGNPQITYFKVVFRRHTNFSMESIYQTFDGTVDCGKKVSCIISRNGDLLTNLYLEIVLKSFTIPASETDSNLLITMGSVARTCYMNKLGNGLIKYVDLEIGGQLIDRHYGEWMEIWAQLTKKGYREKHYNKLVTTDTFCVDDKAGKSLKLFIPLQFWFCNNPGLALPLIALQYHEVKVNLYLEKLENIVRFDAQAGIPGPSWKDTEDNNIELTIAQRYSQNVFIYVKPLFNDLGGAKLAVQDTKARNYLRTNWRRLGIESCTLYCNYIFLDTDERRRFAQTSHEYLINQLQFTGSTSISLNVNNVNIELDLNHPVKELIWVIENNPHLEIDQIAVCPKASEYLDPKTPNTYRGYIQTNSVDPADKFTWFNNSATCSYDGYPLGLAHKPLFSSAYINGHIKSLIHGKRFHYIGTRVINPLLPKSEQLVDLIYRPKSALRFWDQLHSGTLLINGMERFSRRVGRYFKWVQTYQHHSGFEPGVNNIYCYSFALKPEDHQPSGTCNFSRIDSANINLTLFKSIYGPKNYIDIDAQDDSVDRNIRVYATNYNVLRIMSGMGGLAFST